MWQGGPEVGLLLYAKPALDFAIEAGVIVAGWSMYRRTLHRGGWAAIAMVALLVALQARFDAGRGLTGYFFGAGAGAGGGVEAAASFGFMRMNAFMTP